MSTIFRRSAPAILFVFFLTCSVSAQLYEWRGPGRTGVYAETGLLKTWPANGPALVWEVPGLGDGYGSPTVTNDAIYVTGRKDEKDVLFALSHDGKLKWETVYGQAWMKNHTGTRSIPTVYNGNIFLVSGSGDIVCVGSDGKIKWSKNHFELYGGKPLMFGISESPVVTGNMVIVSPGGTKASMVAFNVNDGKVIWEAEPLGQEQQYINPKLIEHGGKKMIVNVMGKDIVALNANDGKLIWKVDYAAEHGSSGRKNHAITPLYSDGHILVANGYGWPALKLKLSADGSSAVKVWENRNFDPQLGGVVLLGNQLYASNHQSQPVGHWICVDWNTGKTLWTERWNAQGSVIAADGMLYLFEEKTGSVALVKPDPAKLNVVSEFKVTKGTGPFWAHPVISNGRLYLRHGDYLMAYKIR
jgi:outer membrane protein assembly factor BamB